MAENKKENVNKTFPLHFVKNKLEDVPKFLEQKDKEWVFWGETEGFGVRKTLGGVVDPQEI